MARIFSILAVIAVLLLGANFVVGLSGGDFNRAAKEKRDAQNRLLELKRRAKFDPQNDAVELYEAGRAAQVADEAFRGPRGRMTLHMLLGAAAALVTLLVNSITVTYFIGTSRWCKEVCETYGLAPELAERSTRLKRNTFPWALAGMAAVIVMVGLGAAADPSGANWSRSAEFVMPHYAAAMAGIVIVLIAFYIQIARIAENYGVIEQIMAEVERVRAAKGMPTEEPSAL